MPTDPSPVTLYVRVPSAAGTTPRDRRFSEATPDEIGSNPMVADLLDKQERAFAGEVARLQGELDRLRTAVENARDTFADFDRTLTALRHHVSAKAARVAQRAMQDALAKNDPLTTRPTTPPTSSHRGFDLYTITTHTGTYVVGFPGPDVTVPPGTKVVATTVTDNIDHAYDDTREAIDEWLLNGHVHNSHLRKPWTTP